MLAFIVVVIVALLLVVVWMYNGLVRLKVQCDNAWADIDVQLKRRYDLIPNLVETVKGYAAHEKGTLEAVINARNRAMTATGPADKAQAENVLSGALKSLFALSEAYPQLRAIEGFTSLQNSLSHIEDTVQNARRYYNAVVRDLNTKILQFPTNIFAGMLGFKQREFFEVGSGCANAKLPKSASAIRPPPRPDPDLRPRHALAYHDLSLARLLPRRVGCLLCPASAFAPNEQQLKKFYSDIVITPDGKVDVTENITFQFHRRSLARHLSHHSRRIRRSRRHELHLFSST